MRILVVIGGYIPAEKFGGPVTSIVNLVDALGDDTEFYIIAGNHDYGSKSVLKGIHSGWNNVGKAKVIYLADNEFNNKKLNSITLDVHPDLIYLCSIFSYNMNFPMLDIAKKHLIPVLFAPRGELCRNAFAQGKAKKIVFMKYLHISRKLKNVFFQATSEEEYSAIMHFFKHAKEKIFLLPNMPCGVSKQIQHHKKEKGKANFLFLGRIHPIKNVLFALKALSNAQGTISFDIYGPIQDALYWGKCQAIILSLPPQIKVEYKGTIPPGKSKEIYVNYDCLLFPTLNENYGHSIAEAIASNCHVIVSRGTTPWDDIDGNGGKAISLDNVKGWTNAINEIVDMDSTEKNILDEKLLSYANVKIGRDEYIKKYLLTFNNICKNFNKL